VRPLHLSLYGVGGRAVIDKHIDQFFGQDRKEATFAYLTSSCPMAWEAASSTAMPDSIRFE
jgi:hypothetical protein